MPPITRSSLTFPNMSSTPNLSIPAGDALADTWLLTFHPLTHGVKRTRDTSGGPHHFPFPQILFFWPLEFRVLFTMAMA